MKKRSSLLVLIFILIAIPLYPFLARGEASEEVSRSRAKDGEEQEIIRILHILENYDLIKSMDLYENIDEIKKHKNKKDGSGLEAGEKGKEK